MATMQWIAINALKPNPRNARTHSNKQIHQIADSISAFGFLVPILIDESCVVIAGHGRHAAAQLLGLKQVPVIEVQGLSDGAARQTTLRSCTRIPVFNAEEMTSSSACRAFAANLCTLP